MQKKHGFTIVELLITIVVIAILASLTIAGYSAIANRANTSARDSTVANILKVLEMEKVKKGWYDPTILMSNGSIRGGTIGPDDIVTLLKADLKPEHLKAPGTPDEIINGFVFNTDICPPYDWDNCDLVLDLPDDSTIPFDVPTDHPQGYSSWDDFYDFYYETFSQYWSSYADANPLPQNPSDEQINQFYEQLYTSFDTTYPDLAEGYNIESTRRVDVPLKSLYIVEILIDAPENSLDNRCMFTIYEYNPDTEQGVSCGEYDDSWNYINYSITGVKINYWTSAGNKWISKQIGTGNSTKAHYMEIPS